MQSDSVSINTNFGIKQKDFLFHCTFANKAKKWAQCEWMIERRNSPGAIHGRDEQLKEPASGAAIGAGHGIEGCRSHLAFV